MPNPDFTGTVPRMRCETCEFWKWDQKVPRPDHLSFAWCTHPTVIVVPFCTTDLSVCSNWKKKEE